MSVDPRLEGHLERMLQATNRAIEFVGGLTEDQFLRDSVRQHAVCMALVVCGENASRILEAFKSFATDHPEIEWRKIKGMRNIIAHGYFDLEFEIIYKTAVNMLPVLKLQLEALLHSTEI
ncbi:uncharacterized protein with HEPN domain [Rhizobium aquaticum]|uniref:Uncharacterized protein with HEPN domain n=1 Tax=Rhizobium aquaticum TaxID=1549636 RepID=A0ABV2J1X9_9HYPH